MKIKILGQMLTILNKILRYFIFYILLSYSNNFFYKLIVSNRNRVINKF